MPIRPPNARTVQSSRSAKRYEQDRGRLTYRRWYNTTRWRAKAADQLRREPLCRMCQREQITRAASICDHVTPHRGDERLFWEGETQSLCKPHHDRDKQRVEAKWRG